MNITHSSRSARRRRAAGLTLLELVVVLLVLAALAGILIPIIPNMVQRSHSSTTAANISETTRAVQLYEATNMRHPDGWDSLIDEDGNTLRDDRFTIVAMTDGDRGARIREALNAIGISTSWEIAGQLEGNGRPDDGVSRWSTSTGNGIRVNTFDAYSGVEYDLTNDGSVVVLGPSDNEVNRLNLPVPTSIDDTSNSGIQDYVVLGIGARLTAVGDTMVSAPVHFPGVGDLDPTQAYARAVAVYAIPEQGPARLAATSAVHNDHLDGLDDLMQEFYETVNR